MAKKTKIFDVEQVLYNPFDLYDGTPAQRKKVTVVTDEILALMDKFVEDMRALQVKYKEIGADDTASREAVSLFLERYFRQN